MASPSFAIPGGGAATLSHLSRSRCRLHIAAAMSSSDGAAKPEAARQPRLAAVAVGTATALVSAAIFFSGRPRAAIAGPPPFRDSAVAGDQVAGDSGQQEEGEEEEEKARIVDEEVDMYERLLQSEPNNVEALKCVLFGRMRKGKVKDAVRYVDRLVRIEPREVEWRLLRALSADLMGDLRAAKKLFREILKDEPLQIRALHGLAVAMHRSNEGPAASEMLNKALELAQRDHRVPEERDIEILIAQMHIVKGDLDGAATMFQELVEKNPRDFRPYLYLGIIFSLQERSGEAEEQFETYRSLVPDELPSRSFLDKMIAAARAESRELLEKKNSPPGGPSGN